jgi:hypothetical protein
MDTALLLPARKKGGSYEGFEFLGEIPDSSVITYNDLSTAMGLTVGVYPSPATGWLKCKLDGKELLVAKQLVRRNLHWGQLYQLGLVYGIDGFGSSPFGTPVNQLRTIEIRGQTYKVRLLKGSNADPAPAESGLDLVSSRNSEFSRIFYPLVVGDSGITSYLGPKLASYTQALVFMTYRQWCQETVSSWKIVRGLTSTARTDRTTPSTTGDFSAFGWRPVLEKM